MGDTNFLDENVFIMIDCPRVVLYLPFVFGLFPVAVLFA